MTITDELARGITEGVRTVLKVVGWSYRAWLRRFTLALVVLLALAIVWLIANTLGDMLGLTDDVRMWLAFGITFGAPAIWVWWTGLR